MKQLTDNKIINFLSNRRSVLAAKLIEPGPDEKSLNKILEVGLRVPDHSRCGPWRIQIIRKKAQSHLGEIYAELFKKNNTNATTEQIEYWRQRPQSAPILVVVTCYPNEEKIHKIPLWEQILSGGAVCQNILHGAHALGFAAQWITEWPAYSAGVREALGHSKDTDVYGFIFIGSAEEKPTERKRISATEVVTEWVG